jgi:hypothetical protein
MRGNPAKNKFILWPGQLTADPGGEGGWEEGLKRLYSFEGGKINKFSIVKNTSIYK